MAIEFGKRKYRWLSYLQRHSRLETALRTKTAASSSSRRHKYRRFVRSELVWKENQIHFAARAFLTRFLFAHFAFARKNNDRCIEIDHSRCVFCVANEFSDVSISSRSTISRSRRMVFCMRNAHKWIWLHEQSRNCQIGRNACIMHIYICNCKLKHSNERITSTRKALMPLTVCNVRTQPRSKYIRLFPRALCQPVIW